MTEAAQAEARTLVGLAMSEDVGPGDWTTLWTIDAAVEAEATIVAKAPLVLAGAEAARLVFQSVDPGLSVDLRESDGASLPAGAEVLRVRGPARSILTAERIALNFLGRLSGIATLTRRFVDAVAGTGAQITDTRKTTPGWRHLEKWAVHAGGGVNHRMGLYDMILVKDNHIAIAGSVAEATRCILAQNTHRLPIAVEVTGPDELEELRGLAVDRILLDNMDVAQMVDSVRIVRAWPAPRPALEASGNMSLDRVRGVAETGVDWISVGALTHSVPVADLSLRMTPAGRPRTGISHAADSHAAERRR